MTTRWIGLLISSLMLSPPGCDPATERESGETDALQLAVAADALSADGATDTGPLPQLPLQFCQPMDDGAHWNRIARHADGSICGPDGGRCDNVLYACKRPVQAPVPYTAEGYDPAAERDCAGAPLSRVAFVVGGMGGELRWNRHTCQGGAPSLVPEATLLVFAGGGGTGWRDAYNGPGRDPDGDADPADNDYRALELHGLRVVAAAWQPGVFVSAWWGGWWSRPTAAPQTGRSLTRRPAAVVRTVAQRLVVPGTKFGVAGTSGGSLQTASLLWHPVGHAIAYAGLHAGGGLVAALAFQCGASPTTLRFDKHSGRACVAGALCGRSFDDPVMADAVKRVVDYWHASDSCSAGRPDPLHRRSSFLATSWDGEKPLSLGFLVNSVWPVDSDMALGAVWAAGGMRVLAWQHTGVVGQWANGVGAHGQVMQSGHPSFALFKAQVLSALLAP